jgi:pyruvate kinase
VRSQEFGTARRERRTTELVCTIGPATAARVPELLAAGMDVARVNFSHGSARDHSRAVAAVREAARDAGRPVALMTDLPGPKVRLGPLRGGIVDLEAGASFVLRRDREPGDAAGAGTNHPRIAVDLRPGDPILLADGAAELRVVRSDEEVVTEVVRGGTIRSGAGVNVPSERLSLPAVTKRDRRLVRSALAFRAEFVAQSFVRRAEDVAELRALLGRDPPRIVAKIETRSAVTNIARILAVADAIMVARGDLGVEIPFEEVPIVQKDLIRLALEHGVTVIVATQMLESMIEAPRPTRAEASDVANAVLDGAHGVLLSAETAIGAYPVEAARAAVRICRYAEEHGDRYRLTPYH